MSHSDSLPEVGVLVFDDNKQLVGGNAEAIGILSYSTTKTGKACSEYGNSERRATAVLATSTQGKPVTSGRRTYDCRVVELSHSEPGRAPLTAVILSRSGTARPDFSKLGVEFGLTPREIETVGLLVEGLSSKEIAQVMGISPNTVKVFIKALMNKMQATGRTAIVSMAMDRVCTC